jgi:hypothetical protein
LSSEKKRKRPKGQFQEVISGILAPFNKSQKVKANSKNIVGILISTEIES